MNEIKAYDRNKTALKYNLVESSITYWKKEEPKQKIKIKELPSFQDRKNIYPEIEEKLKFH